MHALLWWRHPRYVSVLLLLCAVAASAIVPGDLAIDDRLSSALYHTEEFHGELAQIPNTLPEAKEQLELLLSTTPEDPRIHAALADVETQMGNETAAGTHLKTAFEKSKEKKEAFDQLLIFYHTRLRFADRITALEQYAATLTPNEKDVTSNSGPYAFYKQILKEIDEYRLNIDREKYQFAIVEAYPGSPDVYVEYIHFLRGKDRKRALQQLDFFARKFPTHNDLFLKTKSALLEPNEAFEFLNAAYKPDWSLELIRLMESYAVSAGRKTGYLQSLKDRLQKNPLDFDAVSRLFYAHYLTGNLLHAQNTLNDYRLLLEAQGGNWPPAQLLLLARMNHLIQNQNEAARYYYALWKLTEGSSDRTPAAEAIHGLFEILLEAEDRPVQIGAGNLNYYRDIARADQHPGILNGLLSLILNGSNPKTEFESQHQKAIAYFNRAQAAQLVRYMQKQFPSSPELPKMYARSLTIFEKYGMDDLVIREGEEFFRNFHGSSEVFNVGLAVADAYARKKNHKKEWQTYDFLLRLASKRTDGDYSSLLDRYISSLTGQKNYLAVVELYKNEIVQRPDDESLYERFSAFLMQSNLLDQEAAVYRQAIERFNKRTWYEKLARWYINRQKAAELHEFNRKVMQIFRGTEVEQYLQNINYGNSPFQQLGHQITLYAHERFPLNLTFVRRLLDHYAATNDWQNWRKLSAQYYFLDETIRNSYLTNIAGAGGLSQNNAGTNRIGIRYAADVLAWRSHFEESVPLYEQVSSLYPADVDINIRLADILRSLGPFDPANYGKSATIRERLAAIHPSDASLWTVAGETHADTENYVRAIADWQNILKIQPGNAERYLEVATILWDYYLFDDSLRTIADYRRLSNDANAFAYEAGAILESKRDYKGAVLEYARSLTDGQGNARSRLLQLYDRKSLRAIIRAHFEQELSTKPQDYKLWLGVMRFYSDSQEQPEVKVLLEKASVTLQGEAFESAAPELKRIATNAGFAEIQEKLVRLQIERSGSAADRLERTLELARLFEAQKKKEAAAQVYESLLKEYPRSAGIIQELTSFHWRTGNFGRAFEIYENAISVSNKAFQKKFLLEVAEKHRTRGDYQRAIAAAKKLYEIEPLNMSYFSLIAKLFGEQKDYPSLKAHITEGLSRVRKSDLPSQEKQNRIVALRNGIVEASLLMNDPTAALDQQIEIINQDSESQEAWREAAELASRYRIYDRLVQYYIKTAAASPRDHRWPLILARLHIFSGDFQTAVQDLQTAISIHPERTDFYQMMAETYQKTGEYDKALATYSQIFELTHQDARWLKPMAELQARLGQGKKALELYHETLKNSKPIDLHAETCKQALAWGLASEASVHGRKSVDMYLLDLHQDLGSAVLPCYAEAMIQTGREKEAFQFMMQVLARIRTAQKKATFESEPLRSAEYIVKDALTRELPLLFRNYLTGERMESIHAAIFEEIEARKKTGIVPLIVDVLLPMAQAAQMAPAEELLLKRLAAHYSSLIRQSGEDRSRYNSYHSQLQTFYKDRAAYAEGGAWLESQLEHRKINDYYWQDHAEAARLYRLAGMPKEELSILDRYYYMTPETYLYPEAVERYLELLYLNNNTQKLEAAANRGIFITANYFIKRKDKKLALAAIQALAGHTNASVWKRIQQAMVGWELKDPDPFFLTEFDSALDLRTIEEQLSQRIEENDALLGDKWFFYGTRFGEYLWRARQEQSEASYYLASDVEGAPTNAARQDQLGNFYFKEKHYQKAGEHFSFAADLTPGSILFQDHRSRALLEMGRRDEAIQLWKSLLADEKAKTAHYRTLLATAKEYQLLDIFRSEIEGFLSRRVTATGILEIEPLLLSYLSSVDSAHTLLAQWVQAAPSPVSFAEAVLELENLELPPDTRFAVYAAADHYLQTRMTVAAGTELTNLNTQWIEWNQQFAWELSEGGRHSEALKTLENVIEKSDPHQESLLLLKAQLLLKGGNQASAMQLLNEFVRTPQPDGNEVFNKDRYLKAAGVLKKQGAVKEAADLLQAMYEKLLLSGNTESSNYIGLAEIHLDRNEKETALALLNRMIFSNGESLEEMKQAAALLEKKNFFPEAIRLREDLARRLPWDQENRAQLAEALLKTGQNAAAVAAAKRVLHSGNSTAKEKQIAAVVLAKSSKILAGGVEMQQLEQSLRTNKTSSGAKRPYFSNLRAALLKEQSDVTVDLLARQFFLDPQDQTLRLDFFTALRDAEQHLQAVELLDPDSARNGGYYSRTGRASFEWEMDEYDPEFAYWSYNPVERLRLAPDQTTRIALEMSDSCRQIGDLQGSIFFLKMAKQHTERSDQRRIGNLLESAEKKRQSLQEAEDARLKISRNLGREL